MEKKSAKVFPKKKPHPPVIRQTVTSKLRLLKANHSLRYELEQKVFTGPNDWKMLNSTKGLKTLVMAMDDLPENTLGTKDSNQVIKPKSHGDKSQPQLNETKNEIKSEIKAKSSSRALKPINNNARVTPGEKLSNWIQTNKDQKNYQHLSEVIKKSSQSGNYEKENTITVTDGFVAPITPLSDLGMVNEALMDLLALIAEGYPSDQCDIWLKRIKLKYPQVEHESQYWECRAALEQTKGNLNLAVECYKSAIIEGAEVQSIDRSLDVLFQKFGLLKISNDVGLEQKKIVTDAKNIFKSSIIQFAVQERSLRRRDDDGLKTEKKFVATPVRRSTRMSRSGYTSTPGVQVFSSLREINDSVRGVLDFELNTALRD